MVLVLSSQYWVKFHTFLLDIFSGENVCHFDDGFVSLNYFKNSINVFAFN